MSTSPEKDLHSVYIDGEMPEDFISRYEAEIAENGKAKAELEKMRSLHSLLQEDAKAKTVDKNFADASFDRLMTKMSYVNTVRTAEKTSHIIPFTKYAASFAAAAAVFAVAFVPVYNYGISQAAQGGKEVAAIEIKSSSEIKPISEKEIVVDGNLKQTDLSSRIAVASAKKSDSDIDGNAAKIDLTASSGGSIPAVEQKTVRASAMVSGGNSFNLPSYDPFRPEFPDPQIKPYRIQIPIPTIEEISDNWE